MMQDYELLYHPPHGTMRVVAFASGSGTNFREAIIESRESGSNFSIDLLLTDKEFDKGNRIGALDYAQQFGVPAQTLNGYQICGSWKKARESAEGIEAYKKKCAVFNHELDGKVRDFECVHNMSFDFALLAGYMRLFTGALLRRFGQRAINVHPADLSIRNIYGQRIYVGENAVYDALSSGEARTRSSIILVDAETDAGAILVSGPWIGYEGPRPVTPESAKAHQAKQKEQSDWPALRFALRGIAQGKFALHRRPFHDDGNPVVVYEGKVQGYEGVVLS